MLKVKSWWYRNEQDRAGKYNFTLCWDKEENGEGEKIYILYGDIINETEKAVQVILKYWDLNKAGRYITDAPMKKAWKTWIPKSVIL